MNSLLRNLGKEFLQRVVFPKRFIWKDRSGNGAVRLTFDDGPHGHHTDALLELLEAEGVRASFFVIGNLADQRPDVVRRIATGGHTIGTHTQSHFEIPKLSRAEMQQEVDGCRHSVRNITGIDMRSLRLVTKMGYQVVHWTHTYSDYSQDGTEALIGRMKARTPSPGDVILLHDHNPFTIAALKIMIPAWKAQGLSFDRLGQSIAT
jgi:peptidoglycan-N-acetylglucosamine deacetylase